MGGRAAARTTSMAAWALFVSLGSAGCVTPSVDDDDATRDDDDSGVPDDDDSGVLDDDDATADDDDTTPDPTWRSALYPVEWAPGMRDAQDRGLADFSYAGYRRSEVPLPVPVGAGAFNVLDFLADPTGASDATAAVQAAIAAASVAGGVVLFPEGAYRIDGLLSVLGNGVVLLGEGSSRSRLRFTRSTGMSDQGHLTFAGSGSFGPDLPLVADGARDAHEVSVADASTLSIGDDVALGWTISDAFVAEHGMEAFWAVSNGQWRAFFRREVVALDLLSTPHRVTLDVPLRAAALLRDGASLRTQPGLLRECGVLGIGLATAGPWTDAWATDRSHALLLRDVRDCWVQDVASFAPPEIDDGRDKHLLSGGIKVLDSKRVTIADTVLAAAQNRGDGGNGYLFEVSRSGEVLFRDCVGSEGRHNFIQNWDFGTSGVVWLRIRSEDGVSRLGPNTMLGGVGASEYHHSLAMANLVDDSDVDDAWKAVNRRTFSSGAGHTATESVVWNLRGQGAVTSFQYGHGYVIGTAPSIAVTTNLGAGGIFAESSGTEPEDFGEGLGTGEWLVPRSLFEDQLARRLAR